MSKHAIAIIPDEHKIYLGDSVYAAFDGIGYWIYTHNGYPDDPRNVIYMEPVVLEALGDFRKKYGT